MSTKLSALTKEDLIQRYKQNKNLIAKYNNLQMAKKIQLNSAYGAV